MECRVTSPVRLRPAAAIRRSAATAGPRSRFRTVRDGAARRLHGVPVELWVLAVAAAVTRLAFLTNPRAIVFDEVYFREYALRYREGSFFFDIHPPLGKLLLAGWAKLFGISATVQSSDPAVLLRLLPALAGTALVVVFYLFLRELGGGRKVATLGASLVLLDNAVLVESRFILMDSMLLLFGFGALTLYLVARRTSGRAHWVLLGSSALLAGMAVATKWTGLCILGLIGLAWAGSAIRDRAEWRRWLPQAAILALAPALIYVGAFAVHFQLLQHSGPGDAFMSQRFQSTLVGDRLYDPAVHMSFAERFLESNSALHRYDLSLNKSTHPYSSTWTSWPLMKRGVYYWNSGRTADGHQRHIYLLGNPLIWWGLLLAALVVAVGWLRRPDLFARHRPAMALLCVGWAASVLPFSTIQRPMFLYHYLFAFLFAIAAVSLGIGALAGWIPPEGTDERAAGTWTFRSGRSAGLYWGLLAIALAGFLYFAPLSYGLPLTDGSLHQRMWLHTWR
jgi:dolichyl-phosphate-mannose-protein mannosyltransferase